MYSTLEINIIALKLLKLKTCAYNIEKKIVKIYMMRSLRSITENNNMKYIQSLVKFH